MPKLLKVRRADKSGGKQDRYAAFTELAKRLDAFALASSTDQH
jgi:hypothetical protein